LTHTDEQDLLRLTAILEALHTRLADDPFVKEAVQKAGLALSVSFMHGLRSEVERLYETLDKPLSESERAHLRESGIDPDLETE
jgi:hypothetical protein